MKTDLDIVLGDIHGILRHEKDGIRVLLAGENVILPHLDLATASAIITRNFDIVCNHYRYATVNGCKISEVQRISVSIVLHYLYIYNIWRKSYPNMANLDLGFREEDFRSPGTFDIIAHYCKQYYPDAWMEKAVVLLKMSKEVIRQYEDRRQLYYNR